MAASTAIVDLKQQQQHQQTLEEEEEEEKEYVIQEKELASTTTTTATTAPIASSLVGGEHCRSLEQIHDGRNRNSNNYSDDLLGGCDSNRKRLSGWGAEGREVASADDVLSSLHNKQEKGETGTMAAVFRASEEGNLDNLKELSDTPGHTVDFSSANKHGETAVHMAASGGHVDVLKFLQDKGVNINSKDKQGDTAVYWAARQGHLEAIMCLHEAGLPLDSQNKSGETALHVAARYGHAHVVDFLCQAEASCNVIDSLGETPLHSAAWHGYSHIVHTLCHHGAALDMRNKEGETALHCAAVRGNVDCVRILLDHDAPLNKVDKRGSTALHLACHRQQTKIAIMLLHAGCQMEALDRETGESALHAACREGMIDVVDTLCDLGCSLTTPTTEGLTPLHVAVRAGHIDVVRSLLMAGAPPDTPNKDGLTGAIIALAQGHVDIAELLSKVKGERGAELIHQLEEGSHPVSRLKLKLLGCTGVGKTLLLESLKAGFLGSFFRTRLTPTSENNVAVNKGKMMQQFSLPSPMSYTVANPTYTKGVDIQQINIAGAGEFSVWDFSGYEPYYVLYDQFLGDVHGVHLVVFSLAHPPEEQLAQVIFWLNFLKARVPPAMPIGYCGRRRLRPRVLLVATHADHLSPGASKDSRGEYVTPPELSSLHQRVKEVFQHDLSLSERLFVLDATLSASADLKALKAALVREKHDIVQSLPKPSGLVEATVAQLVTWRREKGDYPVVTWGQLADMVRSSVNPLASQEHVRLLTHHLQLMGEIQYIESESSDSDLIVLSPHWLCGDILGTLLSPHHLSASARGGKAGGGGGDRGGGDRGGVGGGGSLSVTDVQRMFPQADALNLVQVFEALEICTQCEENGEVEFEFPCLNFMDPPSTMWQKEKDSGGPYQEAIYGGVRLHTSFQSGAQLKYLIPRIQVFLRRNMLEGEGGEEEEEETNESDDEGGGERQEGRREQFGESEGETEGEEGQREEVGRVRVAGDSRARERDERQGTDHAPTEAAAADAIGEINDGGAFTCSSGSSKEEVERKIRDLAIGERSTYSYSSSSSPKLAVRRKRRDLLTTGEETEELGKIGDRLSPFSSRNSSPRHSLRRKGRQHARPATGGEEETAETGERVAAWSSSNGSKGAASGGGGGVVGLQQWHCGSRYRWGLMEGVMVTDLHQQFLEIKVRGPQDSRYALFFFLQDFVNVVEQVVERVCPGLTTERYILSPSQLRQHGHIVRSYSPTELLRMQMDQKSSLVLTGTLTESFLDVACMGCEEVLQHITLGMDQEVSQLTVHTQRLLSQLLDPPDKMGRDWCLLAVTLGLADILPALDSDGEEEGVEETDAGEDRKGAAAGGGNSHSPLPSPRPHTPRVLRPFRVSQTQRVLAEWCRRNPGASVRDLTGKLRDLNRLDAVEAVLRTTPAFTTVTCDDPSTDESGLGGGGGGGAAHGTDTSTNTLLSR